MNIEIRTLDYRLSDTHLFYSLEKLGDFYSKCFKAEYEDILNNDEMVNVASWNGRSLAEDMVAINCSDTVTIGCFIESTLLGTAIYAERQGYVYIWGMYVDPLRLREGNGKLLIKCIAESVAPDSRMEVSVIAQSTKAMSFYSGLGFKTYKTEVAEVFPKVELSLNVMQCAIDSLE